MEEVTVNTQEVSIAPSDKPQENIREFITRAPDWRYQTAVSYIEKSSQKCQVSIPTDKYVQMLIRILSVWGNEDTKNYIIALWPNVATALYYGTVARTSNVAASMEVGIINGVKAEDLNKDTSINGVNAVVYNLFYKFFFDLSGITAVHAWINDFLLNPARYSTDSTLLRTRLMAYYGGLEAGLTINNAAGIGKDTDSLMRALASTERKRRVFDYMTKCTKLDNVNYAMLMESAIKTMTEREFQEHMRDRDEAGSSSLTELAANLERGIRAFTQKELDDKNISSVDFSERFTSKISTQEGTPEV